MGLRLVVRKREAEFNVVCEVHWSVDLRCSRQRVRLNGSIRAC